MVWDVATGDRSQFTGHAARVNALAFSPDATTLWSGGDDGAIFAWDLQQANTLQSIAVTRRGRSHRCLSTRQTWSLLRTVRTWCFHRQTILHVAIRDVATGASSASRDRSTLKMDRLSTSFSRSRRTAEVSHRFDFAENAGGILRVHDVTPARARRQSKQWHDVRGLPRGTDGCLHPGRASRGRNPGRHHRPRNVDLGDTENVVESSSSSTRTRSRRTMESPFRSGIFGRAIGVTPDGTSGGRRRVGRRRARYRRTSYWSISQHAASCARRLSSRSASRSPGRGTTRSQQTAGRSGSATHAATS